MMIFLLKKGPWTLTIANSVIEEKVFCGKAAFNRSCSLLLSAVLLFGKISTKQETIWTLLMFDNYGKVKLTNVSIHL